MSTTENAKDEAEKRWPPRRDPLFDAPKGAQRRAFVAGAEWGAAHETVHGLTARDWFDIAVAKEQAADGYLTRIAELEAQRPTVDERIVGMVSDLARTTGVTRETATTLVKVFMSRPTVEQVAEVICKADTTWAHHEHTGDYPCSRCQTLAGAVLALFGEEKD